MKLSEIKLGSMQMQTSMSFVAFHSLTYVGKFDCFGLSIHEKSYTLVQTTPKSKLGGFKTASQEFYLNENPELRFPGLKSLILHYCGKEIENE